MRRRRLPPLALAAGLSVFLLGTTGCGGDGASISAASQRTTPRPKPATECTRTLRAGLDLTRAISRAPGGAVICLGGGSWSFDLDRVDKNEAVTVRSAAGARARIEHSLLTDSSNIRFQRLEFTGGVEMIGGTSHIDFLGNELTGRFGIRANGELESAGTRVTHVRIVGNAIHDVDYTGSQGTADGYGITAVNGVAHFTIADNTIESVAADYIQSASPVDFEVVGNTLLGPTLVGGHPQEHQDLWQIFGGGRNITFADNVARNTGTHESLLFQEGEFTDVVVENNLFDHDSRGYTCQLYQSAGLIFRYNTIVGSHWGCLLRDDPSLPPGSGYQVDHNVFADTEAGADFSTEGRAGDWGRYGYNVSTDRSASGPRSVRNWNPSWLSRASYLPRGLPFRAGYRAP